MLTSKSLRFVATRCELLLGLELLLDELLLELFDDELDEPLLL